MNWILWIAIILLTLTFALYLLRNKIKAWLLQKGLESAMITAQSMIHKMQEEQENEKKKTSEYSDAI